MRRLIKNVSLNGDVTDVLIEGRLFKTIAPDLDVVADEIIDGSEKAIMPTFVNMHTHASMALLRGYADDLGLHEWLTEHIWPLESQLTEEDIYHGARLACLEMIKSGTVCFNDMYWHYNGIARAVEEMGLRAVLSAVFIDFNDEKKAAEQRDETRALFEASASSSDRITFALGPHSIYTVSPSSLAWITSFAQEHDLLVHIHVSETEKEVADCQALHGLRPVEWLEKIGFLGPHVIAAHVIHVTDAEIALLAKRDVKVVHNPVSNMKLASGAFPFARMQQAGVKVSIGTDGSASNNNVSMMEEMKFAALQAKLTHKDPTVLSAQTALEMATSVGAESLRLNVGRVEEGALADCMLVDLNNSRLVPGYHLAEDMVYSADSSVIDTVICNGVVLMQNGYVDGEDEIIREARQYRLKFNIK